MVVLLFPVGNFVGNKVKGLISKRVLKENKAHQIFRKTNISYSLIHTRAFFGKYGVLCFIIIPVLRFALLHYYRQLLYSRRCSTLNHLFISKTSSSSQTEDDHLHNIHNFYHTYLGITMI